MPVYSCRYEYAAKSTCGGLCTKSIRLVVETDNEEDAKILAAIIGKENADHLYDHHICTDINIVQSYNRR